MESALRDQAPEGLNVIETLRWDAAQAPSAAEERLRRHLRRCAATCARLAIPFDLRAARDAIDACGAPPLARVRLTVDLAGRCAAVATPHVDLAPGAAWRVALAPERLEARDPWLQVKTSRRALYDAARAHLPDGVDEMLFANGEGALCEGAITNLFVEDGRGLATPPLICGLLPGVLREELLESGGCREAMLRPVDLARARAVFVGNALRGLIPAQLVD
ncbi:MAG: aminotransferase class IV [Pseudomonadota bacterium]